jgi:hypothetical protein
MAYGKTVSISMQTLLNPKYSKRVATCAGVERIRQKNAMAYVRVLF